MSAINVLSALNSTNIPLLSTGQFTGKYQDVNGYNNISISTFCDTEITITINSSYNGVINDVSNSFIIPANTKAITNFNIYFRYANIIINNSSVSNQTFLEATTRFLSNTP